MHTTQLKICGLKDPDVASEAVRLGVGYIGLLFHPDSKRHVELNRAKSIAVAVHEHQGRIVPVFVNQTAGEIREIAAQLNADLIQLHGIKSINAYPQLRDQYRCIVVENLCDDVSLLNPERDYLLYDCAHPGSGKTFNWNQTRVNRNFRSFIAGGITLKNAKQAIEQFHPFGLDVSSGAEDLTGNKNINMIKALIHCINDSG